ncbi:hypothetical protein AKJ40_02210 [candidate division MSBL1 archaeon SCGC-AAA259M10]|uniref:Cas12f1-like TNB domain-containing protein n=2 Tax=candidate division MSBL1 TaxID=215777 RepID=A0A133U6W8_9EURY|nr:hypothetical protein AKJ61_01775 [candidate division MSBL1 archaeon SCGC-AAA259B11]KXA99907.1 hypothetical protein AKJ40_02210 [candidate division MSBL1 archaeon SCGC-AAA259M10]
MFEREGLDFREKNLNKARKTVKELCYPTADRDSKYNCKGVVHFSHSHYYDTAITEATQKWNSFLTWKEKSSSSKKFPEIKNCSPVLDSQMFELDLEKGWITVKTGRGQESVHIPITVPNKSHYDDLDEDKISSIKLKKKEKCFVFLLSQKLDSPETPSPSDLGERPVIGIDLGERNLAPFVTIRPSSQQFEILNVKFFDGAEIKKLKHREENIRKNLQIKGKSSEIPKRKWKTSNKKKNHCEKIANKIRKIAKKNNVKSVFVGDLKAPTPKNSSTLSKRLNNFPFAKLKEAIKRHLEKAKIFVKTIYEGKTEKHDLGTSQKCHKCGSEGERYKGKFSCPSCNLEDYNADLNAAINIAERGVKSFGKTEGLGVVPWIDTVKWLRPKEVPVRAYKTPNHIKKE